NLRRRPHRLGLDDILRTSPGEVNLVPRTYVRGFRACPSGSSEHLPREIGARAVFKVSTEEIISRGESPHLRTGRSVVRGKLYA
ncbi:MAG: hypothetical protein V3T60_10970, partial [Candidatus Binatia bacterium]